MILTRQEQATATALGRVEIYERRSDEGVLTPFGVLWKPPKNVGNKEANPFYDVSLERREPCFAVASQTSGLGFELPECDGINDGSG